MQIFGKPLSEYVAFSKLFLGLIFVVGIVRLALSLAGVPNSTAKWVSITGLIWIGVLYFSIRVHTSGFGSYKQLLPIFVLQGLVAQVIIVPAIMLAIWTGTDNIYSAPDYSGARVGQFLFGANYHGKTWFHAGAHLLLGTTIAPLVGWLVGSLIMLTTRKLVVRGKNTEIAARAC
jgi:hypothetical protein